jgi:hypothetical protein
MHFPPDERFEFVKLEVPSTWLSLESGGKWLGGKFYRAPGKSPSSKLGVLDKGGTAPGTKPLDDGGGKYSAKEKKEVLKREEEMKAKEMGIEVKPEAKPKPDKNAAAAKRLPPAQDIESAIKSVAESRVGSVVQLKGSAGGGFKTGSVVIPVAKVGEGKRRKLTGEFNGQLRTGRIKGDWLVEKDGTVSHIPSGMSVGRFHNYKIGQSAVDGLMGMSDKMPSKADINAGKQMDKETVSDFRDILSPFREMAAREGTFR